MRVILTQSLLANVLITFVILKFSSSERKLNHLLLLCEIKASDKSGSEAPVEGMWCLGGEGGVCECVSACDGDDGTVPAYHHPPPSCAEAARERTDSVGLLEVGMEIVGVDGMSLIVI